MSISSYEFSNSAVRCAFASPNSEKYVTVLSQDNKLTKLTSDEFKDLIKNNAYNPSPNTFCAVRSREGWHHVILKKNAPFSICFEASSLYVRELIPAEIESLKSAYKADLCFLTQPVSIS